MSGKPTLCPGCHRCNYARGGARASGDALRATSHTRLRAVTNTLQALLLVEKAKPVQVRYFTLRLRDQRSMWMQDGCKIYMNSYMASNRSCFMVSWTIFKNNILEVVRSSTKPGDHGIPNVCDRWFILFYHAWGPAWIRIHWNSIWVEGPITCDFTLHLRIHDHTTWCWRCVGTAFGHSLSFGLSQH
jgi:hypothetical protein